jgi:aspartyl-tRNA(Asn)/glutamyl-tRNA(Gln) amidotransferase subunit A
MRQWLRQTAHELLDGIESGAVDSTLLFETQDAFAREVDGELQAFLAFNDLPQAPQAPMLTDGRARYSRLPYAAKDIFTTAGIQSTAGSRILEGYLPPYDATCVALLKEQHCGLIGKTNLDEFAMGSSGENSGYGPTRNPWHLDYVPGGSSSGSAAAVAALQAPLALGTDTGGVRQPASFTGIVGFRPTYGTISRRGLIAYSSSCDQAGIFTRCSLDAALAMNTLSQPDPLDSTCAPPTEIDYFAEAQREVHWEGLRIGILKPFFDAARIEPQVLDCVNAALKAMTDAGAHVVELDTPLLDTALPAYYIITAAECSSNLARFDGVRYGLEPHGEDLLERYIDVRSRGFGSEVKRRILLGTYVLSKGYAESYYDNAREVRRSIRDAVMAIYEQVDVIVTPTSPTLAFKLGARTGDPLKMYLADQCTVFVNLFGGCGISVPCGFGTDADGVRLPVGVQFVAPPFLDSQLLRIAAQYEELVGWKYEPPEWVAARLAA